jgi:hypothetical protein
MADILLYAQFRQALGMMIINWGIISHWLKERRHRLLKVENEEGIDWGHSQLKTIIYVI